MRKNILMLLFVLLPSFLFGNEVVQNGISYSIDEEKKTAEAIGYDQSSSYVTIPSTITIDGKVYSVVSIGKSAFDSSDKLLEVTIEDGVEEKKIRILLLSLSEKGEIACYVKKYWVMGFLEESVLVKHLYPGISNRFKCGSFHRRRYECL